MKIAWFSAGATSAVACKIALQEYNDVQIYYIETGSHHPDNKRFIKECENWYSQKINILKSAYKDHFEVFEKTKVLSMRNYTPCTRWLKVRVREDFEYNHPEITHYIWGFESGKKEENRAKKMVERYPQYKHLFPLIENHLDKASCLALLKSAKIEIPEMYKLGFHNNNCIGCVRGGAGYWNRIREYFPEQFKKMAEIERKIGYSVLKNCYLDELKEDAGRNEITIEPECSIFCGFVNFESEKE